VEHAMRHGSFMYMGWRARTTRTLAAASLLAMVACGAARRPALVFEYGASDGQFSYSFELYDDRTWKRSEHSGTITPRGRLSPVAMRRFEALLRAAPFVLEPRECDDDPREWAENAQNEDAPSPRRAWAEITDASRNRSVRTEPCFTADETTHRLLNCLEVLVDRGDFRDACRLELPGAG